MQNKNNENSYSYHKNQLCSNIYEEYPTGEYINYIRRITSLFNVPEILMYSLFGGACGAIMFNDDPFYGFSIFAWTIIIMYIFIILFITR